MLFPNQNLTFTHQNTQESHQALIPIEIKEFKILISEEQEGKTVQEKESNK